MIDEKKAFPNEISIEHSFYERVEDFLLAYHNMPSGETIVIHPGAGDLEGGGVAPALVIRMAGKLYGFTSVETRMVGEIAQSMTGGDGPVAKAFEGLQAMLLQAADGCEQHYGETVGHGGTKH